MRILVIQLNEQRTRRGTPSCRSNPELNAVNTSLQIAEFCIAQDSACMRKMDVSTNIPNAKIRDRLSLFLD